MDKKKCFKCKECTKKDATKHRSENLEKIREYDRGRGCRNQEYIKEWRKKYKKKYKAHSKVNNALRDGKLKKLNCEVCGASKSVVAHHDDYDFPLSIRWLCEVHHKEWHLKNGEGKNGL